MLAVYLFLCFAIVPVSYGNPVDEIERKTNSTTPVPKKLTQAKDTKITVASEGGAITSISPKLSLPRENQAFLMTSATNISSNKVKARKGAILDGSGNISTERNSISNFTQHEKAGPVPNITLSSSKNLDLNQSSPNTTKIYKPTVVSSELIAKADLLNNDPAVDDSEERLIRIHKTSSSGHPGMVTPIIITVLVVPIFAMIGYMALKRGQEAWKNRHYKRMDFLLDGMYNE